MQDPESRKIRKGGNEWGVRLGTGLSVYPPGPLPSFEVGISWSPDRVGYFQYAQKIEKRKGKKKKSTAGQLGQKVRPTASNDRPLCDMKKSPPAEHAVGPNSSEEHGKTFASQ